MHDDPLKGSVVHAFDGADGVLAPFYAFGVDAYRLADRLALINEDPDARLTGAHGRSDADARRPGPAAADVGGGQERVTACPAPGGGAAAKLASTRATE